MKTLFSLITACFLCCNSFSQVVIYSTDFGTTSGTFPLGWSSSNSTNGFAASTVAASAGYSGASGSVNARFMNTGAAAVHTLVYNNSLSTLGYQNVRVSWACRTTATFVQPVSLEWSTDGVLWNVVLFTQTPANTDWTFANGGLPVVLPIGAGNISNLRLRWSIAVSNDGNYQIDDVLVEGFLITGGSSPTDYFRSRQSGSWNLSANWESSADNSSWNTATLIPTSSANTITIRNGHTVLLNSAVSADQLTIESGAVLQHPSSVVFSLGNGVGDDMIIDGTYVINGAIPAGLGTYVVNNGAVIRADANTGGNADDLAMSSNARVLFLTGSIFEWNNSLPFSTSGVTYFSSAIEKPVFRISANIGALGGALTTTVNGLLEVNANVTFDNAGTKIFRDGVIGSGTLNQSAVCGSFQITGVDAQLGGAGIININNGGLMLMNGALVSLISNKTINGSGFNFFVNNGARLNCDNFILSGTTGFVLAANGTLGIGSPAGITSLAAAGNVQTSLRSYNSGANYIYTGSTNQVTGNFTTTPIANTVNTLTIANTGTTGSNTVTLSVNNTTASSLYLNNGLFAAGTNQTLRIANGGNIYGNGANNPNNASAGNIEFLGDGATQGYTTGNPFLYSIVINSGNVDFNGVTIHSATIMNRLQLNSGSYVSDAPYYQSGSSLIYNAGGSYARNAEWGSLSNQGYPHHVIVQGGTVLNLNTNTIIPARLEITGDLIIGNVNGNGGVYLNNSMSKPLSVLGNLVIGSIDAAANNSILELSSTGGGDLWLNGNFTRYNNSDYTDNGRAVFFKGSISSSVNTPNITITAGVPTQNFSYLIMEKNAASDILTLNCPVGITGQITFTTGVLTTSAANLLVIESSAVSTTGSVSSFVNGPVRKKGGAAFTFPTGVIVGSEYHHRTIGITATGDVSSSYTAMFYRGDSYLRGTISSVARAAGLQRISRCEYWSLSKESGTNAGVELTWTSQSPCNPGYVTKPSTIVAVQFNGTQWGNTYGGSGTGTVASGSVVWLNGPDAFSYFTLGSTDFVENPLPYDLSSFKAEVRKTSISLDWETNRNTDLNEFIIERSRNCLSFEALKKVIAKPGSNLVAYVELDERPFTGWNYYRLRTIDKLGKEYLSTVIKLWFGAGLQIRVAPNPASEKIVINFSEPSSISEIDIVNISGRVLKRISTIQFNNEINISHLQAGMYYVRITGKNGLTTISFIKQ